MPLNFNIDYKFIFNAASAGMAFTNESGVILDVNSAWVHATGIPSEDAIGRSAFELGIWANELERKACHALLALHGHVQDFEAVLVMQSEERPHLLSGRFVDFEGKRHVLWEMRDISVPKRAERALNQQSDRAQRYLDTVQTLMVALDEVGNITMINRAGCELLGYQEHELMGHNWFATCLPQPDGIDKVLPVFRQIMSGDLEPVQNYENPVVCSDGTQRMVAWYNALIDDPDGHHIGVLSSGQDITEQKQAEMELRESHQQLFSLLDSMAEGAYGTDVNGNCTFVNRSFLRILGFQGENEVVGQRIHELIHHSHADGAHYPSAECKMHDVQQAKLGVHRSDEVFWHKDGYPVPVEYWFRPVVIDGEVTGAVTTFVDISKRIAAEEKITQLAFYDPLTRLPNRRLFSDRMLQAMMDSERSASHCALMILDLDNFKSLNDSHGHQAGDLLLIEVARRLVACVREIDTVARFGGDEFLVLLKQFSADQTRSSIHAERVAEKIRGSLAIPYHLDVDQDGTRLGTIEHDCSASIGLVLFKGKQFSPDDLLKLADEAMYRAKEAGRNLVRTHEFKQDPTGYEASTP